jgi:hypothetical protein
VTMKNDVFCDVAPCGFNLTGRFGGMSRLHLQGRRHNSAFTVNRLTYFLARVITSALKLEAICSSETSVCNKTIRPHIPEDGILQV